jgi:hypothetical protein
LLDLEETRIIVFIGCRLRQPPHVSSTLLQRWIKPEPKVRVFFA